MSNFWNIINFCYQFQYYIFLALPVFIFVRLLFHFMLGAIEDIEDEIT